jgi:3-hydroxyacyl-[acyl-carrier-protein] dehydratase
MKRLANDTLDLGPDVVRRLLAHRPPLLLVDRVLAFSADPPVLRASRYISGSEPVFAGHFPQLSLWPGVYTIEGMGQACNLLYVLLGVRRAIVERGLDPTLLLDALRNAERGFTLNRGYDPSRAGSLQDLLPDERTRMGMAAHVDVKLLAPVFAGCTMDYRVELVAETAPFVKCSVEAVVAGVCVARGTLTSTSAVPPLPPEG